MQEKDSRTVKETPAENAAGTQGGEGENHAGYEQESRKKKKSAAELEALHRQNDTLTQELADTKDALLRLSAEFDNYKKRTVKEREALYADSVAMTVSHLLPVLDNLERAAGSGGENETLQKGVEMIHKQMLDVLSKLNITEIAVQPGDPLDPDIHNAMMHADDETLPPNCVGSVLMKGYRMGDKIIRHTMIKSVN